LGRVDGLERDRCHAPLEDGRFFDGVSDEANRFRRFHGCTPWPALVSRKLAFDGQVGQSMGGMIAQLLASPRPDLVASLCLLYTSASNQWLRAQAVDRQILDDQRELNREQAITEFLVGELACRSDQNRYPQDTAWLRQLAEMSYDRDPVKSGNARQAAAVLQAGDRLAAVSEISAPTAVLTGDADLLIDPEASTELHEAIRDARLQVFAGMGHEVPEELWADIAQAITINANRATPASCNAQPT
jgi:pimeloyl-ACP methyl ester carboxylesterase